METSVDGDAALLETTVSHASSHSEKEEVILRACKWRDLDSLKALAESPGGFLTDDIRQQACKSTLEIPDTISFVL
jgi:hypothetical protein